MSTTFCKPSVRPAGLLKFTVRAVRHSPPAERTLTVRAESARAALTIASSILSVRSGGSGVYPINGGRMAALEAIDSRSQGWLLTCPV